MGAPSRGSFRSCFVIAGPCLLVIVVISIFLCQNLAQVDRGHIARHALQLQELIFAPSSDGTAPPTAANAGTADVVPEVAVETSSSTIAPLVEEKKERGNSSDPGAVEWFDSSYFATVPREKTLKCPLEATVNQWNGRLGNHIHQILNMVLFAHLCSIAEVHFPKHQDNTHAYSHQIGLLDMPTTLSFPPREQILNHPLKCPRHSRHTHPWFGNYCFTNTPMWVYHQLALHFVRPYLGDYIRECLTIPEDADAEQTLTVHMRADDVAKYPEYSWGQPPCSMYEKIIKENKFSRIIFVKKGDAPCAKRLLAVAEEAQISVTYPPAFDETNFKPWHMRIFYRETHNLATDFCTLMRARHLVLSYSTFSVSAALLSTSIKTMYRRREALWESYLKSPGINCNTWPGVTMYDYGIQMPKNKTRHGSVEWLTNYPISEIGGPTACSYDPRQEAALFSQSKATANDEPDGANDEPDGPS